MSNAGRVFGTSENSPYNGLHYSIKRLDGDNDLRMIVSKDKINFAIAYDARTQSDGGLANIGGEF